METKVLRKIFGPKGKRKNEMVGRVPCVGERRDTYRVLVGKPDIKRPLGRLKRKL